MNKKERNFTHRTTQRIRLLLELLLVRAGSLGARGEDDVDESAVVLDSLLGAPSRELLLVLLLLYLGGLVLDLTGTRKRAVDLSSTAKAKHEVQRGLLLDVVVGEGAAILKLLAGKDETLLIRGDALLVLDLGLDVVDGVAGLDLEGDGFARQSLDEDLHFRV